MKYAPGAMVGVLSRSIGSTTASHNRFGAYLRGRVIPTNPNTAAQVAQRTSIIARSQEWRALTSTQRAGWTALGLTIVRTDSLGQTYNLTGLQTYTFINRNLVYVGSAVLSTAPTLLGVTAPATATLTATSV
jgi:hypothetical protein